MLSVRDVRSCYGRIEVLHGISMEIAEGEVVVVIGANGAGKTTLMRAISGVQPISSGEYWFRGERLSGIPAFRRVGLGIAQVPEGRQIFGPLSVEENLQLGAWSGGRKNGSYATSLRWVYDAFPVLEQMRQLRAGELSGGQQQMLAIGRALMSRPKLLLLDEPSMGLAPLIVAQIFATLRELKRDGMTILLVEQNANAALGLADRAYVMETGTITLEGAASTLAADPRVREAYLGR
ncbi:ABC transporter ATP-binding protein [Cupriavidus sp. D39]|uniref:ABC transporter ATP-binding protein n=1 Tax=Cupriavidus sp. D39 TaxID=2997877 RepID=UPI00226D8720|nr:ABC transporter ATP-binding protein [Cupriavidus sp. D39]MCY0852876.1 ABC transporter ATP-binding protein [Cupriavidus sp. D39]